MSAAPEATTASAEPKTNGAKKSSSASKPKAPAHPSFIDMIQVKHHPFTL